MRQLLAFCESQREWLLDTIETLVRLESPSTDKPALEYDFDFFNYAGIHRSVSTCTPRPKPICTRRSSRRT